MKYSCHESVEKVAPTETTRYIYDEERLLQETDGADDPQREYTFADEEYGQLVSQFDENSDESSFYQYDGQWSTNALINADESPTDRYRYRAFGLEVAHAADTPNPFQFVGKQGYYRDSETELYFLGMAGNSTRQGGRFYDPVAGRFISKDPIGLAAGDPNEYRYVENNPINVIDPSGLESEDGCDYEKTTGNIRVNQIVKGRAEAFWVGKWETTSWWTGKVTNSGDINERLGVIEWFNPGKETSSRIMRSLPTTGSTVRTIVSWADANQAAGANAWFEEPWQQSISTWWGEKTGVDVWKPKSALAAAASGFVDYFGSLGQSVYDAVGAQACKGLEYLVGTNVCATFNKLGSCGGFFKAFAKGASEVAGAFFTSGTEIVSTLANGAMQAFESKFKLDSLVKAIGEWLGLDGEDALKQFGDFVTAIKDGNLGKVATSVLGFFDLTLDKLGDVVKEAVPVKFLLPVFGIVEKFLDKGVGEGIKWITDIVGEKASQVQAFIESIPQEIGKLLKDGFGELLLSFVPTALKKLGSKLLRGGVGAFFSLLDGIANACDSATKFIENIANAVKSAATGDSEGGANVSGVKQWVEKGIDAALVAVLKIIAAFTGVKDFPEKFKQKKSDITKKITEKLKEILKKITGPLESLFKSKKGDKEPITPVKEGEFKAGGKFEVYAGADGKYHVSWNPDEDPAKVTEKTHSQEQSALGQIGSVNQSKKPTKKDLDNYRHVLKGVEEHYKDLIGDVDWCAFREYAYLRESPSGTWTDFVVANCNGSTNAISNPHGHHIVMKDPKNALNKEAQNILCRFEINPFKDCANLVISSNKCHSGSYARRVLQELFLAIKNNPTKGGIVNALKTLAKIHQACPEGGQVDLITDE